MTLCFLERAGCAGGGKGILCSEEKTFTLSTVDNMRICMQEVYSVDPKSSNSMKSSNPHSGFHVSKVIKTLDTSVPDPSKNQGGHIILEEMVSVIEMGALARGQGNRVWNDNCPTLRAEMGDNQPCVMMEEISCFDMKQHHNPQPSDTFQLTTGNCSTIRGDSPLVKTNTVVRRLTPIECERLQGFPDNYTNIPWANKATAPDSRRYKALGNSMAVPVMLFIGKRIEGAREVVYDEEAIRKVMLPPLSDDEIKQGQQMLF